VLGAVLVVSGPTVIGPLLDFIRPSKEVNSVLKWEGTLADPIGATLGVRRLQRRGCRATAVHGPIRPNPMVDRSPRSEGISRTVLCTVRDCCVELGGIEPPSVERSSFALRPFPRSTALRLPHRRVGGPRREAAARSVP
jgi:hypothetical protein